MRFVITDEFLLHKLNTATASFKHQQFNISFTTGLKAIFDPSLMHKVQPSFLITKITKRQIIRDEKLSVSLEFFSLQLELGPNAVQEFQKWSSDPLCICLYLGTNQSPLCFQECYPRGHCDPLSIGYLL